MTSPAPSRCAHRGFHEIRTSYDRRLGLLVYHWACERCGTVLGELCRRPYRPAYDPWRTTPASTASTAAAVAGSSASEPPAAG